MSDKTGGHAFPVPAGDYNGSKNGNGYRAGMTLRDYFAAAAMQGMLAYPGCEQRGSHHNNNCPEWVAAMAYDYADAMLEARERK